MFAIAIDELRGLSPRQLAAFAAGVARRVMNVYAKTAEPVRSEIKTALELVWSVAAGEALDGDRYQTLHAALDAEAQRYLEDDAQVVPYSVLRCVRLALETAAGATVETALRAAHEARGQAAEADHEADAEGGDAEEAAWQRRWLAHVASIDPAEARAQWVGICNGAPAWYVRWDRR